jgi:hypothetical protein
MDFFINKLKVKESIAYDPNNFAPQRPVQPAEPAPDRQSPMRHADRTSIARSMRTPSSSSGLHPFPTYGTQAAEFDNPNILNEDVADEIKAAEDRGKPFAKLTASHARANAAIAKAMGENCIFVDPATRRVESQETRQLRSEMYLYFIEPLPNTVAKRVNFGDIYGLFLLIMSLGQRSNMATRRELSTKLATLDKGTTT